MVKSIYIAFIMVNVLFILLILIVIGSMTFLLKSFLKRLKRIEKEMWEEKARRAEIASKLRKEQAIKARKEAAEKEDEGDE